MEHKVIRHDERLSSLWINTNIHGVADYVANRYLKEMETSEYDFKVIKITPWKKDTSMTKVEYLKFHKENSVRNIQQEVLNSRIYTIEIIDNINESETVFTDKIGTIGKYINGSTISLHDKIFNLEVGSSITHEDCGDYDGDVYDTTYNITRLS